MANEAFTNFTPPPRGVWKDSSLQARLTYMNNEMFAPHPDMTSTIRAITSRMDRCTLEKKGGAIFIEAPSGGGKTTLVRYFRRLLPDELTEVGTKIPIVGFSVPKVVTIRAMDSALLRALGDPKTRLGDHFELDRRGMKLLASADTQAIFIDNIQDIPEKRRAGGILQIGNWIRDLIDSSKILVVLLGTKDSRSILNSNIQLKRRCPGNKVISYFNVKERFGLNRLGRFLREIDERLPLVESSNLGDNPRIVSSFAYATGGIQDYIFQIISIAISNAVNMERERILVEDLSKAYEEIFQDLGKELNPFSAKADHVLDQVGEPLHGLLDETD